MWILLQKSSNEWYHSVIYGKVWAGSHSWLTVLSGQTRCCNVSVDVTRDVELTSVMCLSCKFGGSLPHSIARLRMKRQNTGKDIGFDAVGHCVQTLISFSLLFWTGVLKGAGDLEMICLVYCTLAMILILVSTAFFYGNMSSVLTSFLLFSACYWPPTPLVRYFFSTCFCVGTERVLARVSITPPHSFNGIDLATCT